MANLIGGHTEGIDMGDWNQWGFDTLLNSTGSLFEYETPDGHRVQITGFDFVYGGVLDIEFGGGTSLLDVYGHTGRIEAVGGDDHNAFFSGEGDDLLVGGASHDDIFGRAGDDEIIGGGGDDDIAGGEGDDTIEGGQGFDRFFFEENGGTDTVVDFEIDVDLLDYTSYAGTIGQDDLAVAQFGADTHITAPDGSTVILAGIQSNALDSSEFLF